MQRVHAATLKWNLRLVDAVVVAATFLGVVLAREWLGSWWTVDIVPGPRVLQKVTLQNQLHVLVLAVPLWLAALQYTGCYQDLRRIRADLTFIRVFQGVAVATAGLAVVEFLLQPTTPASRTTLFAFAGASIVGLYGVRRAHQIATRGRGQEPWEILVVGSALEAGPVLEAIRKRPEWGFHIAGVIRA